jgi:hypothetical protein
LAVRAFFPVGRPAAGRQLHGRGDGDPPQLDDACIAELHLGFDSSAGFAVAASLDGRWAVVANGGDPSAVRLDLSGVTAPLRIACACQPALLTPLMGNAVFSLLPLGRDAELGGGRLGRDPTHGIHSRAGEAMMRRCSISLRLGLQGAALLLPAGAASADLHDHVGDAHARSPPTRPDPCRLTLAGNLPTNFIAPGFAYCFYTGYGSTVPITPVSVGPQVIQVPASSITSIPPRRTPAASSTPCSMW